jgi:hypothetical protein
MLAGRVGIRAARRVDMFAAGPQRVAHPSTDLESGGIPAANRRDENVWRRSLATSPSLRAG